MNKTVQNEIMKSFMSRVNKLNRKQLTTSDKFFGTVKLVKSASESATGTRKFSVRNSCMIRNGSYTIGGLRNALTKAING